MNKATALTIPCLIATLLTPALSCGEEFRLYTPKPDEGSHVPASPDEGILVRSIKIQRGDTLSKLSQKHLGRGSWYPQVLLFNKIKNPDLIITGNTLLVPVPAEKAAASGKRSAPEKKHVKRTKHGKRGHVRHRGMAHAERSVSKKSAPGGAPSKASWPAAGTTEQPPVRVMAPTELDNYRQAKQAYLNGEYQKSVDLFSEFLRKYPNSSSSADAALYRADSLLHLSGQ